MTLQTFTDHVLTQRAAGETHIVLPVSRRLSADLLTPVSAFLALRQQDTYAFLLESVEGGEKLARYSFLGKAPYRIVTAQGQTVTVHEPNTDTQATHTATSIFDVLEELLNTYEEIKIPDLPRFTGGAVGFLGYDTIRLIEDVPPAPTDELNLPDAVWGFYDTIAAFDHVKHQIILMAQVFVNPDTDVEAVFAEAQTRLDMLATDLRPQTLPVPEPVQLPPAPLTSNFTQSAFEDAVRTAKHHIYEGDIFQVVLSQRFQFSFTGDRFNLYRALRQVNPSPYLYYLDFQDFALVGSSPEVLVRAEAGRAELLPIAGTRPRGATLDADRALAEDLLADPKERAEHVMLVDLGRNDLGRVCTYGSVAVENYAYIERYSHVMHIVSAVAGTLREDVGPMDVIGAAFPAGTVSGAPKVRAMELINALEPTKRGVYAGAVGYLDFSGNLDTCIAIRTMVVHGDHIYVQAGAGIVADSDPTREYEETQNKARALQQAILLAGEGLL